jgi:hypothetical protein
VLRRNGRTFAGLRTGNSTRGRWDMSLEKQAHRLKSLFSCTRTHLPVVHAIFWFQIVGVNTNAPPR